MNWMSSPVFTILSAAWLLYLVVLTVWVVLQKRAPEATVGWILTLALLPYVGFVIFYFFGPQRLRRQYRRRLHSQMAFYVSDDLEALKQRTRNTPAILLQLARLGVGSTGIYPCTAQRIELLSSGAQAFDAIMDGIRAARRHVHLEYYIFEPDQTGTRLRDLLLQKAREGVEVRLLIDALGSKNLHRRFLQPLVDAGVQVARFHDTRFGRRWRPVINYRTHRKIVVCDGELAFTGGVNITDEEDLRVRPDAYHDMHIALQGNPAFWLQIVFLEDWAYATGRSIGDSVPHLRDYLPVSEVGPYDVQVFTSGPNNPAEPIHRCYVEAIHAARERVLLTTPYFVPTEAAMMALTNVAMRGVEVHLLVPRLSDSRLVTLAARSYFDELIEAGVTVWEYGPRMLHSKTMVVDAHFGFIGTANFDIRSFRLNYEVGVGVYSTEFAHALAAQFELDLRQARKVPAGRQLPLGSRLAEASARLFSPML
ncbi:cardiolipin synthase [Corticibacter populi]|uniref:Cardiolipin synthase n=1 Tax=Corticibacter populi TaxID=1550736 RepID=A0A3M6QZJ1_9BURK|nr:cardiolipin synthase [Corticibacter populi]RMX08333.1 cardiolipin synthase [Corticibacter populi]RZS35623.1 cardiolipin synthase [Corticibacter populi]